MATNKYFVMLVAGYSTETILKHGKTQVGLNFFSSSKHLLVETEQLYSSKKNKVFSCIKQGKINGLFTKSLKKLYFLQMSKLTDQLWESILIKYYVGVAQDPLYAEVQNKTHKILQNMIFSISDKHVKYI